MRKVKMLANLKDIEAVLKNISLYENTNVDKVKALENMEGHTRSGAGAEPPHAFNDFSKNILLRPLIFPINAWPPPVQTVNMT